MFKITHLNLKRNEKSFTLGLLALAFSATSNAKNVEDTKNSTKSSISKEYFFKIQDCTAGLTTCGATYQVCDDLGPWEDQEKSDLADYMDDFYAETNLSNNYKICFDKFIKAYLVMNLINMTFVPFNFNTVKNRLIFFLLIFPITVWAQSSEPIIARAHYKFSHQYDTTNTNLIKAENYVLFLGRSSSAYKSYDRVLQDSAMAANYRETGMMTPANGRRADGEELYYYYTSKKAFLKVRLLGNYAVEKPFNNLSWKIEKETKKIENLTCQKATTTYMGRNYVAWFTSSLPFQAGPWKLHGLPGLIISAYDTTGRIKFDFTGFEQVKNSNEETAWDKKATTITWDEYKNIAKAAENDPLGYAEKRFGAKITTSTPMKRRILLAPSKSVNFPLEVETDTRQ